MERGQGSRIEVYQIQANQLVERVKELVAEGNASRIIIKHDGRTIVEIPVTVGVVGALLAPELAVLGAIAAAVSRCTIEIVRAPGDTPDEGGAAGTTTSPPGPTTR